MLKTIVWKWRGGEEEGFVMAVVCGHHEVNAGKVKEALSAATGHRVVLDTEGSEGPAREAGFAIGYVSPASAAGRADVAVFVDPDAAQEGFWATGADEADHHVKHFNWKREVLDKGVAVKVADIRNAAEGDPSPKNDGGVLRGSRGIELGHVFKLGTKYSEAMGFTVIDEEQKQRPVIMGCYGIGIGRIVASAIERCHDENGIIWPAAIAPYDVVITPIKYEGEMRAAAERLEAELTAAGLEALVDDRDERPGVKFKDADLIGVPIRLTIGEKGLAEGAVEFSRRDGSVPKGTLVKLDEAVARCLEGRG